MQYTFIPECLAMPREPNPLPSEQLRITTTRSVLGYLDELVLTGLYGRSRPEAAERLLTRSLEELIDSGTLTRKSESSD